MKYDNDVSLALVRMLDAFSNPEKRAVCEAREIISRYNKLGPNARRVLLALADRLVVGIPHGDFDKPHDWDKESSEEALDLAVYQAAKLLGLGKESSARSSPELEDGIDSCPYSYIDGNGKKYLRCRKGSGPLVDADGRTPDGKPWVPPVGARVRVVHAWKESAFFKKGGDTIRTFVVKSVEAHDKNEIAIDFEGLERRGYCLRVVPA